MSTTSRTETASDAGIERFPVHNILTADIERAFAAAQPRLRRIARMRGACAEAADDLVQETFYTAWRSLDMLRTPERLDAWLDGICRNLCRRWAAKRAGREADSLDQLLRNDFDVADAQTPDPLAELDRADLEALLDQALGYLPSASREAVELYYLASLPQQDAARRLGMTINALEVRLHRARKQLRDVLSGELRAEALALGWAPDDEPAELATWQETRIWCPYCGAGRLRGRFVLPPHDGAGLFLLCPQCGRSSANAHIADLPPLATLMSEVKGFKSACSRLMTWVHGFYVPSYASRQVFCPKCGAPTPVRIDEPCERPDGHWDDYTISAKCHRCNGDRPMEFAPGLALCHPVGRRFWRDQARIRIQSTHEMDYAGRPALRITYESVTSCASLVLILARDSFEVLDTFTA